MPTRSLRSGLAARPGHPLTADGPDGPALLALTVDGTPLPWTSIGLTSLPSGGGPAPTADQVLVDPSRGVIAVEGAAITGTVRATFYRPAFAGVSARWRARPSPTTVRGR